MGSPDAASATEGGRRSATRTMPGTTRERGLTRTVEPRRATRGDAVVAADAKEVSLDLRGACAEGGTIGSTRTRLQGRVGRTDSVEVCTARPWHTSHLPRCLLIARTPACGGFPRARFPAMSYDRALSLALGHSRDAPRAPFVRSLDRSFGTSVFTQTRALRCFTAPPYPPARTLGCSTRRANFVGARWTPGAGFGGGAGLEGNRKVQEHMRKMQELGVFKVARATMPPPSAGSPAKRAPPRRPTPSGRLARGSPSAERGSSRGTTTTRPTTPSPTESRFRRRRRRRRGPITRRPRFRQAHAPVPRRRRILAPGAVRPRRFLRTTCGVILACDGEWKTTWLVRSANNGSLSGGWRGFAVDQRLAVGSVDLPRKNRVLVFVTVHRARRFESRDDSDDDARRATPRVRLRSPKPPRTRTLCNHGAKPAGGDRRGAPDPRRRHGGALARVLATPRGSTRRRRLRRRARAAASPDECAEMAARAAFDDVERSAANLERVEDISNASRARAGASAGGRATPVRVATNRGDARQDDAKTNVATPAITMDALGSPACTPAPPRRRLAGAERAAIAAARPPFDRAPRAA